MESRSFDQDQMGIHIKDNFNTLDNLYLNLMPGFRF
jgi:hypothetical protein